MKGNDSADLLSGDKVQTSIRIPQRLLVDVQRAAGSRGQTMNSLVTELLHNWAVSAARIAPEAVEFDVEPPDLSGTDKTQHQLQQYLRWLPAVATVRELHGRIIFANGEYQKLVDKKTVAGHLPGDDFDEETARYTMERHEEVRDTRHVIWSKETVCVRGEHRRRLVIRFPILKEKDVQSIGALGFDLDLMTEKTSLINPKASWQRAYRLADRPSLEFWRDRLVAWPDSLLQDFMSCFPAIATVKDLEGRLLCPNPEYTRVTGKLREDVVGRLPIENWSGTNQLLAELIMYHDLLVRETGAPFISVEAIPTASGNQDRLNVRFPIFASDGSLEMTGQLGFEFSVLKRLLAEAEENAQARVDSHPHPTRAR